MAFLWVALILCNQAKQSGKVTEVLMELGVEQQRCLDCLVGAINELGDRVEPAQLETTAELIIQTMRGPWRYFHTPEHIFEVGGSKDAIEVLAALFHDLVYVQVDQGVGLSISSFISPFVKEVRGQLVILPQEELYSDRMFDMVAAIFGFAPSQGLSPFSGQNEFLSAVIAGKCLEPFLSKSAIAKIAACIEATIPFRPKTSSGLTASEVLYERLLVVNREFNLGWSEEEACEAVRRSVRLGNRDVENFAYRNSADFLDNTWNLLPETNHELLNTNSYTVRDFRRSLQKMEGFMNFLKPDLVFQQFMGEPDDATYLDLAERTKKNIEVAKLYLGSKLVAMAILEALSYRMGRDIPLSTMMGELPGAGGKVAALEHLLPDVKISHPLENALESEVLELLSKGRIRESTYDIKNSPTTTFIIKSIGFESVRNLLKPVKDFFAGSISSEEFLCECDEKVVQTIISGVEQLFESRKAALRSA